MASRKASPVTKKHLCVGTRCMQRTIIKRQVYLWDTSYSRPLSGEKCTATNIPENLNHKTIIRCWVKDTLRGRISFSSWRLRGCRCSEGGCLRRNTIENTRTEIACHQHGGRNVPRGRPSRLNCRRVKGVREHGTLWESKEQGIHRAAKRQRLSVAVNGRSSTRSRGHRAEAT